jgi:hypothetical protein
VKVITEEGYRQLLTELKAWLDNKLGSMGLSGNIEADQVHYMTKEWLDELENPHYEEVSVKDALDEVTENTREIGDSLRDTAHQWNSQLTNRGGYIWEGTPVSNFNPNDPHLILDGIEWAELPPHVNDYIRDGQNIYQIDSFYFNSTSRRFICSCTFKGKLISDDTLDGKVDKESGPSTIAQSENGMAFNVRNCGALNFTKGDNSEGNGSSISIGGYHISLTGNDLLLSAGTINLATGGFTLDTGAGMVVQGSEFRTNVGYVRLGGGDLHVTVGTINFNPGNPSIYFNNHYLRDVAYPTEDGDAVNKRYVDTEIIKANLGRQIWLSPVKTVADLLTHLAEGDPKDPEIKYLCRVTDDTLQNHGVYQGSWIDDQEILEWRFYGDNLDFIDPAELTEALEEQRLQSNNAYLGKTAKAESAKDSDKLGGKALADVLQSPAAQTANTQLLVAPATKGAAPTLKAISDFATAAQLAGKLDSGATAANSSKLEGLGAASFLQTGAFSLNGSVLTIDF